MKRLLLSFLLPVVALTARARQASSPAGLPAANDNNTRTSTGVAVYPASGRSVFIANPTGRILRCSLLTSAGTVVTAEEFLEPGIQQMDVSALPAGTYQIRVEGIHGSAAFQFAKV